MNALTTAPQFSQADIIEFGNLPKAVRDEVDQWIKAMAKVTKPFSDSMERIATEIGCSVKTAWRNWDAWRKGCTKGEGDKVRVFAAGDWRMFINYSRVPEKKSALTPEFVDWFKALAEKNQRKTKPAYRRFCSMWKSGQHIPGMDNSLKRHSLPAGFGYDNVNDRIQDEFGKLAMRRGLTTAIAKCGPKIFTTRVNLWPMSHMPIDDLEHDNFVVFSNKKASRAQMVRVLELDAMDVFTGKLLTHGTKPQYRRDSDGKMDGLGKKYVAALTANVFFTIGYSPRGTIILCEHGTGAMPERVARILYDHSGGLIRLRESGMTCEEQVICGQYGRGKGNPRFKACLESIRNLKHNELGWVPAQTGKDRDNRPEQTHGILSDCADMLRAMCVLAQKNPARAEQLKLNVMDYHAHFVPLLIEVYREINARTWHQLEGWDKIPGNVRIDYRTTPSSDHWLTDAEFSDLPEISKQLLLQAAAQDERFLRPHRLSPGEAWDLHAPREGLIKLPPFVVGELLWDDLEAEEKIYEKHVRGAYFELIQDQEISFEPMRFKSVITTPEGQRRQLPQDKYNVFVNPFDPGQLFVYDARKVCLGVADLEGRVDPSNPEQFLAPYGEQVQPEQLKRAYGERAKRLKELTDPILERHAETVREEAKRAEHNARVLDLNKPFTEDEKTLAQATADAAKTISGSGDSTDDLLDLLTRKD